MTKNRKQLMLTLLNEYNNEKHRLSQKFNDITWAKNTLALTNKEPELQDEQQYQTILDILGKLSQLVNQLEEVVKGYNNTAITKAVKSDLKILSAV